MYECGCKCHGVVKIIVGVLFLLNAFVWPLWNDLTGWIAFFGILAIIGGIIKLAMPKSCCGKSCQVEEKLMMKRRR